MTVYTCPAKYMTLNLKVQYSGRGHEKYSYLQDINWVGMQSPGASNIDWQFVQNKKESIIQISALTPLSKTIVRGYARCKSQIP